MNSDDGLPAAELLKRSKGKQAIVAQLTDNFSSDKNADVVAATRNGILATNTPDAEAAHLTTDVNSKAGNHAHNAGVLRPSIVGHVFKLYGARR